MSNGQGSIRIMCPNLRCRSVLGVPPAARGRVVRCRHCGTNIRIPDQPGGVVRSAPKPDEGAQQQAPSGDKPSEAA